MSCIRVSIDGDIPVTEKELKIHFSKPGNGGGDIRNIYFPLFNNDAVIAFEDEHTAETALSHGSDHIDSGFKVTSLPFIQAFPLLKAEVDERVTAVLQSTQHVRDEIEHIGELKYHFDNERNQATLTGNWYQLEWAWAKIDNFMHQQKRLQRQISGRVVGEEGWSAALPKGKKPIMGDSQRPIISFPNTSVTDDEDQADSFGDDDDVEVIPGIAGGTKPARSIQVSNHGGRFEMSIPNASLNDKSKLVSPVTIATAELKDKEKHVTFTPHGSDQPLAKEQEDLKKSLAKKVKDQIQPLTKKQGHLKDTFIIHDKPDDLSSLEFEHRNLNVNIYTGEITLVETDVIVNAAMGPLINAGGVAKAIARAASPEMQKQCKEYVRKHGSLATSEVMHTCAGGTLNDSIQHILHAVGPVWSSESQEQTCKFQLIKTFLNCFNYGNDKLKISSMTLPVISSGIFGCPLEVCIRAFVDAILLFTSQHEQEVLRLKEVHLINNSEENTALTVVQVRQLIEKGLDKFTDEAIDFYGKMQNLESEQRMQMGKQERNKAGTRRDHSDVSEPRDKKPSHLSEPKGKKSQPQTSGRPLPALPKSDSEKKVKKK